MKVSFANMMARLCMKIPGADVDTVMKGIGLDKRIGPDFLNAGIAWGGSCFPKDLKALVSSAKEKRVSLDLVEATLKLNNSEARVKQLWGEYKRTGTVHQLKSPGRPAKKLLPPSEEQTIVDAFMKHKCGAVYLERILKNEGFNFSHNIIHNVLMKNRLSSAEPNKSVKKKYVKYERRHSMSMWHTDWYEIADPRWRGKFLLVYLDDSSRFIAGYGVYDNATADNAIKLLDDCIAKYGKPRELLTDRGSQFYSNFGYNKSAGTSLFQQTAPC
jgi:hypothetical protein